jgi:hypothetical protein
MATPTFDDDFGFHTISEPLHVQAFISELAVKAFVRPILPWLARLNKCAKLGCLALPNRRVFGTFRWAENCFAAQDSRSGFFTAASS